MTLELERTPLSSNSNTSPGAKGNPHEPLVLAPTALPMEQLVVVEGSPSELAVAVIRAEDAGTYCYPHGPAHPRLGPFGSAEEALEACREVQRAARCCDTCCLGR
jgi:hypothetical protein